MRKGLSRRHRRQGGRPAAGRKGLPFVAFEGLEGRSLFSASLNPLGDLVSPAPADEQTFGSAVATKGNLALVGSGMGQAALYDTSTNTLLGTYADPTDTDGWLGHQFGYSVAFFGSGDSFAIGAPGDNGGKVYMYMSPTSSPMVLSATDSNIDGYDPNTWSVAPGFGTALAGYGDHLLADSAADLNVGGNGTVHEIDPLSGAVVRNFNSPDVGQAIYDGFGTHMAVSGNQILFYSQETSFYLAPSTVYLFDGSDFRNDQGQVRRFDDPTGDGSFMFGTALAFDGDTVVIGAPGHDTATNDDGSMATVGAGAVYQYSASSGQLVWQYQQPSTIPTAPSYTFSGWGAGLAISNGHLMIGASMALNASFTDFAGQVYAYDLNTHEQLASAVAPDSGGQFGGGIAALPGDRFLVADAYSAALAFDGGVVHVYGLTVDSPAPETSPPVAKAGDDQSVLVDQSVSVSGAASTADAGVNITNYEWDFDYDGTNFTSDATGVDATHTYDAPGTYTVALKVTDDHGKTSIDTLLVTVALPPAPTADAGPDAAALNGQTVSLGAGATGTGLSYAWDFNYDGVTFHTNAVGATTSVSYAASGSHTVALRVTDAYGQSTIDTLVVTTKAPAPTADAGADRSTVAGNNVSFHGTAAAGLGATVAGVAWDFDFDGVTFHPVAAGTDVNYVYLTAGLHTVAFRVTDSEGNVVTDTASVNVTAAAPTADAGADVAAVAGNAVALHGLATAGTGATVAAVEWDFNYDGVTFHPSATGADASATYTTTGAHTVAFRVTDSDGQTAIDTLVITVAAQAPTADAGAAQSVQTGQTVTFHGAAAAGLGSTVASVQWDFNYDGTTFHANATGADASTVYNSAGNYIVAVRVTDADGQSTIDTTLVTVVTPAPVPQPVVMVGGDLVVTAPATSAGLFLFTQTAGGVSVSDGTTNYGTFSPTGSIVIHGSPVGNLILVPAGVTNPVQFYGGPGVDIVQGGAGNDILVGGGGVDVLSGGGGRNLLIGGGGSDVLVGSSSDDILIAGSTSFDNDPAALARIMAEWTSSHSYTQRVNNLQNVKPAANRLNGSTFLIADTTVFDDAAVDVLTGGSGQDWFLFNNDKGIKDVVTDAAKNEVITDLDLLPH